MRVLRSVRGGPPLPHPACLRLRRVTRGENEPQSGRFPRPLETVIDDFGGDMRCVSGGMALLLPPVFQAYFKCLSEDHIKYLTLF